MATGATSQAFKRLDADDGPYLIDAGDGRTLDFGSFAVRFMAFTEQTGGGFSLIEHPIPPHCLVAPLHRHSREDEYSFVLEGRMGALLGEDVIYARAGQLAVKPRNQWHTFWNPDDVPCRVLEIISPGGFEHFFEELADALSQRDDPEALARVGARYGLELDADSVERLCTEHDLKFPLLD